MRMQIKKQPGGVCRGWEFVPPATEKNPTLTILAVVRRGSDYLAEEIKKGNL